MPKNGVSVASKSTGGIVASESISRGLMTKKIKEPKAKGPKLSPRQRDLIVGWLIGGYSSRFIQSKTTQEGDWPEVTTRMLGYYRDQVRGQIEEARERRRKEIMESSFYSPTERVLARITMAEDIFAEPGPTVGKINALRGLLNDIKEEIEGKSPATVNVNFLIMQQAKPILEGMEYVILKFVPPNSQRDAIAYLQGLMGGLEREAGTPLALPPGVHRAETVDTGQEQEPNSSEA